MINSSIEWVGETPRNWSVRTLYQLASQVKNKNSDLQEQNLLSLSYGKIKRKDINTSDGLLPASFDGYNIIQAGDIVLRLTDLQNDKTSLRVGLATERGIITSAYVTLRPTDIRQSKYLYYLLHTFDIKKGFYGMGAGVRQGLNYNEVRELRVLTPPQAEMDAIAKYLDEECAKTDALIAETKASIKEYKLWKASTVSHASTKGMSSTVTLRDSGIDWIGMMPSHWEIMKAKWLFNKESRPVSEDAETITCFRNGTVTLRKNVRLQGFTESLKEIGYQGVMVGDLVIHTMDAFAGSIGVSDSNGKCTPVYSVCTAKNCTTNNYYYQYAMHEMARSGYIQSLYRGIRERSTSFTFEVFGNQMLPVPPLHEQEEIAAFLDNKAIQVDRLITDKEQLINELESYKQSLIYEVVTGKRKVG